MQTTVYIPAEHYTRQFPSGWLWKPCTIVALVGVGSSNADGSYNADVHACAMWPDGLLFSDNITKFRVMPEPDLAPIEPPAEAILAHAAEEAAANGASAEAKIERRRRLER